MGIFTRPHLIGFCAALATGASAACTATGIPQGQSTAVAIEQQPVVAQPPAPVTAERPTAEREDDRKEARALGAVDFQVSCDQEVEREIEHALALLHHMMYAQSRAGFEEVARRDADCAMAHWGIAMTIFHPLWGDPPTDQELQRGVSAIGRAREIGPGTERERAYIEAAAAYYEDWQNRDEPERLEHFARAAEQLSRSYPNDPDAAAFHALALLATAPAGDSTYAQQRRAAAILTGIHEQLPRHPGAIHYGIHAHDYPPLAAEGVFLADAYDAIAPDVPHALHMPSHIFVRLGDWRKSAEWNRRSAEAAARQSAEGERSMHYAHAMDYVMYSYLQRMQDERAAAVIEEIDAVAGYEMSPAAAYAIAAIHARPAVEQRDWQRAAELSVEAIGAEVPWDELPFARAVLVHARGLGAARSGDTEAAAQALAELDAIARDLEAASREESGLRYWHERAQVQRDTVAAWLAHARGQQSEARRLMTLAAEREEAAGKHPIMPGFLVPAREQLGDLLLAQQRPGPALEAYEASMRHSPRRANTLYGAARAAEQLGDRRLALDYSVRLAALASDAEGERPILRETLAYLEAQQQPAERRATR